MVNATQSIQPRAWVLKVVMPIMTKMFVTLTVDSGTCDTGQGQGLACLGMLAFGGLLEEMQC